MAQGRQPRATCGRGKVQAVVQAPVLASQLLPSTGHRLGREAPKARDKRKEAARAGRPCEKVQIVSHAAQGSSSAAHQGRNRKASRATVYGTISALRKYVKSTRSGDGNLRRSSKELGVDFPTAQCDSSPSNAHHYVEVMQNIYRCKHCWTVLWQPHTMYEAKAFVDEIHSKGLQQAYRDRVDGSPKTLEAIVMMSALRVVRGHLDDTETATTVAAIVNKYRMVVEEPRMYYKEIDKGIKIKLCRD